MKYENERYNKSLDLHKHAPGWEEDFRVVAFTSVMKIRRFTKMHYLGSGIAGMYMG